MRDLLSRRNITHSERTQVSFYSELTSHKSNQFLKPIRDLDILFCSLIQVLAIRKDGTVTLKSYSEPFH